MKLIAFLIVILSSATSYAAPNCKYVLNQDNYAQNASGKLTVNAIKYRCSDLTIGQDIITVCKNKDTKSGYDFVVAFDGAEADFGVYAGLNDGIKEPLCNGQATSRRN